MYHPYFRGKLNELLTIRETASLISGLGFVPIIEPVKEALNGLTRTIQAVISQDDRVIVVVNPFHGDLASSHDSISSLLNTDFADQQNVAAGVLLKATTTTEDVLRCCRTHRDRPLALIHAGFADPKNLVRELSSYSEQIRHVFFEEDCGKLYQKNFQGSYRVLIRDGFQRRKNREHPELELFSDLHATFELEGMNGFGDFLIVGDDYSDSGGPAYAVAIHLTFIDAENDGAMYIHHFVSDRQDTPKDPAGKFLEALRKMMAKLGPPGSSPIMETAAVTEFRALYARRHFPGLGYIKKLSMQHHIETLADYFANRS
jgi:hypothetical protein